MCKSLCLATLCCGILILFNYKHVSTGLPWELLYADDLVVMAETEEELSWKGEMEKKGLRINIGKMKVMCSELGKGRVNKSANYPCEYVGWVLHRTQFGASSVNSGFITNAQI